jgi:hypothetical protein
MKQIALAILMYNQDYDETFPRTMVSPDGKLPPEPVGWYSVNEYQQALNAYIKMGRGSDNTGKTQQNIWWDPSDPDRNLKYLWGSFADNGYITGCPRTLASIASPASTILSTLRVGGWEKFSLNGGSVPSAPPGQDDPFWRSGFFDMCADPWVDSGDTNDPFHWSTGKAIPPCSLFPQTECGGWDEAIDNTRYNGKTLYSYCDGHVKVGDFKQTYRSATDNDWDIF